MGREQKEIEFNRIFQTHQKRVYNLALQYVLNSEDAAEVAQDVFLSVYQKIESFNEESTLSTWIYRITINKSLDFIKAKNRQKRSFLRLFKSDEEAQTNVPVQIQHPGLDMEHREELETLMQHIYQLPENQKTAIVLLRIEGLSQEEVAEILKLSTKAVESLFQRAKTNLKKILTESKGTDNPLSSN